MPPNNSELTELVLASKLLAKTIDDVDENVARLVESNGKTSADLLSHIRDMKETLNDINNKLEVLPLTLAGNLESLIAKRTKEAFEDVRTTLDELRNKMWAIKKQVSEQTGAHKLLSKEPEKEKDKDGLSLQKDGFKLFLPLGEGAIKTLKIIGYGILTVVGLGGASGGIWVLVDRIRHLISGGG